MGAASSAALAAINCVPAIASDLVELANIQFMPFASNAADGRAFENGQALINEVIQNGVTQENLDAVANGAVRGLGDAGIVDGTGIAGAVARGATEIVAFLNLGKYKDSYENPVYLTQLFPGQDSVAVAHTVFNDPNPTVFSAPPADMVRKAYNGEDAEGVSFSKLELPDKVKHLDGLKVGTITCNTADNKLFGIAKDKEVTLHVVCVESSLDILLPEDFYRWNELVQDIVNCGLLPHHNHDNARKLMSAVL